MYAVRLIPDGETLRVIGVYVAHARSFRTLKDYVTLLYVDLSLSRRRRRRVILLWNEKKEKNFSDS